MFKKKMGGVETLVGRNCEIRGNLFSKGTIRIDGKVEGKIISNDGIIVGESATIKGDLEGKYVIIAGEITGDVVAQSKLEILHSGKLFGDIKTPRVVMAEGVIFEGTCEMEKALQENISKK